MKSQTDLDQIIQEREDLIKDRVDINQTQTAEWK